MRHKRKFTEDELSKMEEMAEVGSPLSEIARTFSISRDTLERMMKSDTAARAAILRGRAVGRFKIRSLIYSMALKPCRGQAWAMIKILAAEDFAGPKPTFQRKIESDSGRFLKPLDYAKLLDFSFTSKILEMDESSEFYQCLKDSNFWSDGEELLRKKFGYELEEFETGLFDVISRSTEINFGDYPS